jgi:hypothetical protein
LQLTVLAAAALFAWSLPRGRHGWLRWFILAAILGNPELIKHAFREMTDALFMALVIWHVGLVVGALRRDGATGLAWGDIIWLVLSGAVMAWVRPAALPILLAVAIAVVTACPPRRAAGFILLLIGGAWLLPSAINYSARGYFATQQFGGAIMLNTIAPSAALLSADKLDPPSRRLQDLIAPAGRLVARASWPYERALMATLVSEFTLSAVLDKLQVPAALPVERAMQQVAVGRRLSTQAIAIQPVPAIAVYTANLAALLSMPGFLTEGEYDRLKSLIDADENSQPVLAASARGVLSHMRRLPVLAVIGLRAVFTMVFLVAAIAGLGLLCHLARRVTGRLSAPAGLALPALGGAVSAYLLLVAMVNAVPRFIIDVWPILVVFVWLCLEGVLDRWISRGDE